MFPSVIAAIALLCQCSGFEGRFRGQELQCQTWFVKCIQEAKISGGSGAEESQGDQLAKCVLKHNGDGK